MGMCNLSCQGFNCRIALVLFGGFLIHLSLGAMYTFGNLSPYIISYLRNKTDDQSIRNVDTLWLHGIGSIGNCLGLIVGGLNAYKFGDRIAILIGSIVFCGSTAMNYFSVQKSYIAWITTQGLVGFFGHKMTYGAPIQTAIKWLPKRAAFATGLIVCGSGAGSLIFNQVITGYINPQNQSPDFTDEDGERYFTQTDVLSRVPTCFLILGAVYFCMQMIGLLCISEPPQAVQLVVATKAISVNSDVQNEVELVKNTQTATERDKGAGTYNYGFDGSENTERDADTNKDSNLETNVESSEQNKLDNLKILQAIKLSLTSRSFYVIWFTAFSFNIGRMFTTELYKAYGQTFIFDDYFLALVGSIAAVFNCSGRLIWGAVMDKAGFRVTIGCMSGGIAIVSGTLVLTEKFPKGLFLVWVCAIYMFVSGLWTVIPSALAKMLGPQNMAINYGIVHTGMILAFITASSVGTSLTATIGWQGLFYITSGLSSLVLLVSFFFNGVDRSGKRI